MLKTLASIVFVFLLQLTFKLLGVHI